MRNLLAKTLYRSFQFSVYHHKPVGTLTMKFSFHGRAYSPRKPSNLPEMLSEVEEYIARDFSYPNLKNELNKDSQLPAVTKQTILRTIGTVDGILDEIASSHHSDTLWPEELNLYFAALIRKTDSSAWSCGRDDEIDNTAIVERLRDEPHFQVLMKHALLASPTLPTSYLAHFFAAFVKLRIPPLSNTMLLLTAQIQDRINEFFPDEVLSCLRTIHTLERRGISHMQPLREGFIMHLENQLLDPPTFARIIKSISIIRRLALLRYDLSTELSAFLFNSVKETARTQKARSLKNRKEAEILLHLLAKRQHPRKFLWRIAKLYFNENPHELTDWSQEMLNEIRKRIDAAQQRNDEID